jgi:hypothetical protein
MRWIAIKYSDGDERTIMADLGDCTSQRKPPRVGGFVPDVYARHLNELDLVIGEAKSLDDIENMHTIGQITAFLKACSLMERALFVMIVPWNRLGLAQATVKYCQGLANAAKVKSLVLDDRGMMLDGF